MDLDTIAQELSQEQLDLVVGRVAALLSWDVRQRINTVDLNQLIQEEVVRVVRDATPYYQYYQDQSSTNANPNSVINAITSEFTVQTQTFLNRLTQDIQKNVIDSIYSTVGSTNIFNIIQQETTRIITDYLTKNQFAIPNASLPGRMIDTRDLKVSADNITAGTINLFTSTGIQDRASQLRVDLSDELTVVDNKLVVRDLQVTGQFTAANFPTSLIEKVAVITLNYIEGKLPNGSFDFAKLDQQELLNLVAQIATQRANDQILATVNSTLGSIDIRDQVHSMIRDTVANAVQVYKWPNLDQHRDPVQDPVYTGLISEFRSSTDRYLQSLATSIQQQISTQIQDKVSDQNFYTMIVEYVNNLVYDAMLTGKFNFPNGSIAGSAINPQGLKITADNVLPGTIRQFESTGIQDRASQCQVVILDQATVFENKLVANDLEVAGTVTFKGTIDPELINQVSQATLTKLEQNHQDAVYDQYVQRVLDLLNTTGVAADRVVFEHGSILENNKLNNRITESNLQQVGVLNELQVQGTSIQAETLYTTNRRVGINTRDPEKPLDIWDQEVQLVFGKRSKDQGIIGSPLNQQVVLSANYRNNLILNPDGSVTVERLTIGSVKHTSAREMPLDDRPIGNIVWNENPYIGGPIGWVSLGGARWASFGTIVDS